MAEALGEHLQRGALLHRDDVVLAELRDPHQRLRALQLGAPGGAGRARLAAPHPLGLVDDLLLLPVGDEVGAPELPGDVAQQHQPASDQRDADPEGGTAATLRGRRGPARGSAGTWRRSSLIGRRIPHRPARPSPYSRGYACAEPPTRPPAPVGPADDLRGDVRARGPHRQPVNLGQGFPDADGPPPVVEAAVEALRGGRNQYPPGHGAPELREAIAAHQQRHYGIELDPHPGGGDRRRDRGDRRRDPRARRPRRRGGGAGAVLRLLRRADPVGRRRTTPGDAARTRLPARRRRARGGRHRPHHADPAEHPAQPDGHGARPATSSRPSPRWRVDTTWWWSPTRSTST